MELIEVESSMIDAAGCDPESRALLVILNSGKSYRYTGVPKKVYEELLAAKSKGSYMKTFVIDAYPYYQGRRRQGK
ncbi:MAG TPA: KTSC domain-containing protein [Chloroflexia bacterium]|nr:KTSC domain-containing protein [Chloroflexia bacterium]